MDVHTLALVAGVPSAICWAAVSIVRECVRARSRRQFAPSIHLLAATAPEYVPAAIAALHSKPPARSAQAPMRGHDKPGS